MVDRIKVALITYIPTPYRVPLFNLLSKNNAGIEFDIFFFSKIEDNRLWCLPIEEFKFDYKFLRGISFKFHKKGGDLFTLHINFSIFRALAKKRYDVIICAGYNSVTAVFSLLYAKFLGKPFIHWSEQTLPAEPPKEFIGRLMRSLLKTIFFKFSDAYIAQGTCTKEFLISNGVSEHQIFISPYATNNSYFLKKAEKYVINKDMLKKELSITTEKVIIYVGQLVERKGVFDLLKAYNNLYAEEKKATSLLLIGAGMLEKSLKHYCNENNLGNVIFLGYKQQEELVKYFAISDVFVLPSWHDTWGIVVNEAMACGLPVIITESVGASGDIVQNGINGYIVKSSSPTELYSTMRKLLKDEELCKQMGRKSIEIILSWNIDRAVDGFCDAVKFVTSK